MGCPAKSFSLTASVLGCFIALLSGCGIDFDSAPQTVVVKSDPSARATGTVLPYFSRTFADPSLNRQDPYSIDRMAALAIDQTRQTLDVCVHEIDNAVLIDAMIRASQRGVRVRVICEADYKNEAGPRAFQLAGIPVQFDDRTALMHNKFMVFDGQAVWTGSFNFTDNCAYKNDNNAVLIDDPRVAANFVEKFRWFWELHHFGGRPTRDLRIPYPVVEMSTADAVVETYFSTHDRVDAKVIALLRQAQQSIKFLAFSFTHDQIANVMIDRARAGVKVHGVFETRQESPHSEYTRLRFEPNVEVRLDGNRFNMHHKYIIIDDQTVLTGSFNFSRAAATSNDENIVILHNQPAIAEAFILEFNRIFSQAPSQAASSNRAMSFPR